MLPCTALAMEIRRLHSCSGVVLRMRGDVREGDYLRLKSHFKANEAIVGLDLSSYGGDFEEGLRIADFAARKKLTVYVSDECDSACADIFFAAAKRYSAPNSRIGVHSISNAREVEDTESRVVTMRLARLWAKRGVPNSAIGKMVTTRPDAITYLNQSDLSGFDVSTGNPFTFKSANAAQPQQQSCSARPADEHGLLAASATETAKNAGHR